MDISTRHNKNQDIKNHLTVRKHDFKMENDTESVSIPTCHRTHEAHLVWRITILQCGTPSQRTNMVAEPVCWKRRSTKQRKSLTTRTRSRFQHRSRKDQTESFHQDSEVEDCRSAASAIWANPRDTVTDQKTDSAINEPTVTEAKTFQRTQILRTNRDRLKLLKLSHRNAFRNESWNRSWDWHATSGSNRSARVLLAGDAQRWRSSKSWTQLRWRRSKIIEKTMQGETVDPDDDQSGKDQSDLFDQNSSDSVLSRSSEFRKNVQQVSNTQRPVEDCVSQDRIKQRTVEPVVNMHAQHDDHTVKMEQSKIIRTPCREIIQPPKRRSIRCDAPAFKPCRNLQRATRMGHLPCRYVTTDANDAKGTEYQSGEHREDFSGADEKRCWKNKKEHPDTLCISTDPVHNRVQSEEKRLTMNSLEQHPRKQCQKRKESMKAHVWVEACLEWRHSEEASPRERLYSKFQERGDARVNQERSVRKDAIVADRSAHDTAKQATISELEAAMKTFVMKVDTAREQRDWHFSRAREGEVTCERETNLPSRGSRAPTANQQSRSGVMLSSGVGGSQNRTTES